jgi:hypothetical protein
MGDHFRCLELGLTRVWGPSKTRSDPRIEGTNTIDTKGDGRSSRSEEWFVDVHHVTIIMKGLMPKCASFLEALLDIDIVSVCKFRLVILCMRLIEFLADVGRGCAHDRSNLFSRPSHSTTMTLNYQSGQGPVGQI